MNKRFLKACRGEKASPVPIWLMRQAGRYLPAYQKVRGRTDFLTLCKTPELAATVTLQPVDILGVDAAILFSDILIPLEPMGAGLAFSEGKGPILSPPVRSAKDVESLRAITSEQDVPFVIETIKILVNELEKNVPLIGFSGAPFTLATYLIEGGTSKSFVHTKRMMFEAPSVFQSLMRLLSQVVKDYLSAQIKAGVQAVQLFDTWAGILSREDYEKMALPHVMDIINSLKCHSGLVKVNTHVPCIYFVFDSCHLLESIKRAGADVIGLDWRTDLRDAIARLGNDTVIQGNLDPCALFLSEDELRDKVAGILKKGNMAKAHIFNLGHGILPEILPEKAKLLVDIVHEVSSSL